jgi:hypothetical protein
MRATAHQKQKRYPRQRAAADKPEQLHYNPPLMQST